MQRVFSLLLAVLLASSISLVSSNASHQQLNPISPSPRHTTTTSSSLPAPMPTPLGADSVMDFNVDIPSSFVETQVKEGTFGTCKTCVFVLERIKKGTNMLLPAICSEIYIKFPDAYAVCHQVLNSLSLNGNNVRYWLFEGCYKYEIYQAKEWVKPCPSHVMCTVLKTLDNTPFCKPLPMEDPFKDEASGGGATNGGGAAPATGAQQTTTSPARTTQQTTTSPVKPTTQTKPKV